MVLRPTLAPLFNFFFFNDTATTEIYTLSLHDALPISRSVTTGFDIWSLEFGASAFRSALDRKSTRLNSSHVRISYAVFCLKKKKVCEQLRRRPLLPSASPRQTRPVGLICHPTATSHIL